MSDHLLKYYTRLLNSGSSYSYLESITGSDLNLSDYSVKEKIQNVTEALQSNHKIDSELIKNFHTDGKKALEALRDGDGQALRKGNLAEALELIVRMDGTRPSFLIRNGEVDKTSSPVGSWEATLDVSRELLNRVLGSVGRVGKHFTQDKYCGTGFLIHQNLLVTNHHVLQCIACLDDDTKEWQLNADAHINFGYELQGTILYPERKIVKVIFAGGNNSEVQHPGALDLAILEMEPSSQTFEVFGLSQNFPAAGTKILTVGYPGPPPAWTYSSTILNDLFQHEYGYKRIAPGMVINPLLQPSAWSFAHDATTLGGSSGSLVLTIGQEDQAAGLHYGGVNSFFRENYAHAISNITGTDPNNGQSFSEILNLYGL